eukprot:c50249_g1_i1 orf=2-592(-)
MSRCHPYPPPGYEKKKVQMVDLGILTKEERIHKEKKQKKKRRKDCKVNGVHDDGKQSNKNCQTGPVNERLYAENGSNQVTQIEKLLESEIAAATVATLDSPFDRSGADAAGRAAKDQCLDDICKPALYNNEGDANRKVDDASPLILSRFHVASRSSVGDILTSKLTVENSCDDVRQRHSQCLSQGGWSPFDDQEWLF